MAMLPTLDIENHDDLLGYLRERGHIAPDESPCIVNLAGGVSNRTVLVERTGDREGEAWVLKQALEKLRVQVDWFSDPRRIHREALGLTWLARLAPPRAITPLVFEDHDYHLLAMQAVPQPHENFKTLLLEGRWTMEQVEQFGTLLGTIQRNAWLQREELEPLFHERDFFESLRLEPYYLYTAQQVPEAATFLTALVEETRISPLTLVHGDYSPKNVLVYNDQLVLLDHEVIHWGDPAFDLGFALTHLLSKARHLPLQRERLREAAYKFWDAYLAALGRVDWWPALEARAVRHTLACLLARVAGRSPLEYLNESERLRQRAAVVSLIQEQPETLDQLVRKSWCSPLTENG